MIFWRRHPSDERLSALVRGDLAGSKRQRTVAHLRGCARCAERHERLVLLERALAGGRPHEPSPAELAALREANRAAILASARTASESASQRAAKPPAPRFLAPVFTLALLVVVGLVVVRATTPPAPDDLLVPEVPEFAARGAGVPGGEAVLRVFCARPQAALVELDGAQSCPPGAALAFSARFEDPPASLLLEVQGGPEAERIELSGELEANRERVLPHTVRLERVGVREVVLTAGGRTLRQTIRVEPDR